MSASLRNSKPTVSIEYFPPKGLSSERALMTGAHALRRFKPDYQTVTFGAGGSAVEGSLDWSIKLQLLNDVSTACHLALAYFNRETLKDFVTELWENNIRRLVVLRGDSDAGKEYAVGGYESVAKAIAAIKSLYPFDISVAAYPEIHPKARTAAADLDVLLTKQDAGANRAITQYFFDNEIFYKFRDKAVKAGLKIPLVPGVIPITNYAKIKQFSEGCSASFPTRFGPLFAGAGDDKAKQTVVARQLIEDQVRDLAHNGVEALHVYSLNRVDLTSDAIRAFQTEFATDPIVEFRPALVG